jgi:hypothetical protein
VAVLEVNRKKRQIRLTMKIAEVEEQDGEEEAAEASITPMELALRQAMGDSAPAGRASSRGGPAPKRTRDAQEDIIARTLRSRVGTTTSGDREP